MGFSLLPSVPHRYTLRRHAGKPDAPVWLLRSLPSRVMLALSALGDSQPQIGVAAMVEAALVGWSGVDRDGVPVEFRPAGKRTLHGIEIDGGAAGELVDMIPIDVLAELGNEVVRINMLDVESAKN